MWKIWGNFDIFGNFLRISEENSKEILGFLLEILVNWNEVSRKLWSNFQEISRMCRKNNIIKNRRNYRKSLKKFKKNLWISAD